MYIQFTYLPEFSSLSAEVGVQYSCSTSALCYSIWLPVPVCRTYPWYAIRMHSALIIKASSSSPRFYSYVMQIRGVFLTVKFLQKAYFLRSFQKRFVAENDVFNLVIAKLVNWHLWMGIPYEVCQCSRIRIIDLNVLCCVEKKLVWWIFPDLKAPDTYPNKTEGLGHQRWVLRGCELLHSRE